MQIVHRLIAAAALFLPLTAAWATSVVPTRADVLAAKADFSVRAIVESVDERAGERAEDGRALTLVRLRTLEALGGQPGRKVELKLRGGLVGERRTTLHGMPGFTPGEEVIVLVKENGAAASPVMALGYGVFRVERPFNASPIVRRNDGAAVTSIEQTGTAMTGCASCTTGEAPHAHAAQAITSRPMALEAFSSALRNAASQPVIQAPALER